METELTVGELAAQADVNRQTVLYYERRGLVVPKRRTDAGYRKFLSTAVNKIRFIKNAQNLGFSLKEIQCLLALRNRTKGHCKTVLRRTEIQIKKVREKIEDLRRVDVILSRLSRECRTDANAHECATLSFLETGEQKKDL